jgi:2-oxoglutarate dehydrogenase E1 component
MYKTIKKHKTTLQLYSERLIADGLMPKSEIENCKDNFQKILNNEFDAGKDYKPNKADWLDGRWSHLNQNKENYQRGSTSISSKSFDKIGKALTKKPKNFQLHKTVERQLIGKAEILKAGEALDWATGEALAFGSLLLEGFPVRLSGQDSARGTFSQRHSVLIDQETEERRYPLNHIDKNQKHYEVIDSMLSEYAVLGFEYGYSLSEPNALVVWEAQFGDFANGAQIMFDQFICSGERKWLRMSGLVMLLPHGFEGQGPEHSSARLERFLQNSAEENWIIANCTTPANYFHILRRQLHRTYRKPLVLMTPKSLLRNKFAVSPKKEFVEGSSFHRVLWDDAQKGISQTKLKEDSKIKRIIACSGKVYYDLLQERDAHNLTDTYLLRVEQLYPVPALALTKELGRFKNADLIWCQEEPKNQGAWSFIEPNLEQILGRLKVKAKRANFVGRPPSASPATGLASQHKEQQEKLVFEALNLEGN